MKIPEQFVMPLLQHLGITPSTLFNFFFIGQVSSAEEMNKLTTWWRSKSKEDQTRYLALLKAIGKPEKITRLISLQYFDQTHIVDLFSGEDNSKGVVYSLEVGPDGKHYLCDDSHSRIDYINSGIGFLETSELGQNDENAAIIMDKEAIIALACIIDFIQKKKYLQAINQTESSSTIPLEDLKKFLLGFEELKDNRWLTFLIFMTFPYNLNACSELNWENALTQLHNLDFIKYSHNEKNIELTEYGMDFCYATARSVKRLALISLEDRNGRDYLLSNCIFIRTWNRVWTITPDSPSGQVTLAIIEPITLFKLLDELILPEKILHAKAPDDLKTTGTPLFSGKPRVTPPDTKMVYCPFCHTPLPSNAKFCRKCGKPIHPDEGGG